jgi:hypothetical protein
VRATCLRNWFLSISEKNVGKRKKKEGERERERERDREREGVGEESLNTLERLKL